MLVSGGVLCLAGLGFVPMLSLPVPLKLFLAATWLALCGFEWHAFRRGYARSRRLRITVGGSVERQSLDGTWKPATLGAGSVVLPRVAWLRIEPRGMQPYAELVTGDCRRSEEWRRLQVIWRHIGAV